MKIHPSFSKILFVLLALFCLSPFINSPIALILGFTFSLIIGNPFEHKSGKALSLLLKTAVVGLGFGIHVTEALETSKDAVGLTIASIVITLVLGAVLGKLLQLDNKLSYLISCGTAICGGSAIAAVSPVIDAKEKQISMALVTVMLLNAIALFIFPSIARYFELTQEQFGFWSAIAIHDTSSVVGAALVYGDESLKTATTIKLGRALWIIPLLFFSIFAFAKKNKNFKFPWFILLFIAAILANSYLEMNAETIDYITLSAKRVLVLCLFLVGAGISTENLKESGIKPLLLGLILWMFVSIASFLIITNSSIAS